MGIKKNLSTEKSRKFWEELENIQIEEKLISLPYLGEPVWKSKHDLSKELLDICELPWNLIEM